MAYTVEMVYTVDFVYTVDMGLRGLRGTKDDEANNGAEEDQP